MHNFKSYMPTTHHGPSKITCFVVLWSPPQLRGWIFTPHNEAVWVIRVIFRIHWPTKNMLILPQMILVQSAETGGLDTSWLDIAFLGGPDFQPRGPQTLLFKGFWDLWTKSRGAPKTRKPTTTHPTPHFRPSDW